jgi:hypothetical protein
MSRLLMDVVDRWRQNLGVTDPNLVAQMRTDLDNLISNERSLDHTRQMARKQRYWGKQAETFAEFWAKCFCPKCNGVNWIYQGHSQRDGTDPDPDGYICRECQHRVIWDESILNGWENTEAAMLEEGREDPYL